MSERPRIDVNIVGTAIAGLTPGMRTALEVAHIAEARKAEHRAGLHPWGSMRRDCPLCVQHGPSS